MYDNITRAIIEHSKPLSGLNMERLPQELTAAYAKIVSLRVSRHDSDGLKAEVEKIERIGKTYLALLLSCQNEHVQSISSVAASAYSLVASYRSELRADVFDRDSVCPVCTSALLYIIADAMSDAAEVATHIPIVVATYSVHDRICQIVRKIALGKLFDIARDSSSATFEGAHEKIATAMLYEKCLQGAQEVCRALLGEVGWSCSAPPESSHML